MKILFDWLLIIISTLITIYSYRKIIYNRYSSIAHFVIGVVYIFCCIPILLNYIIGIPNYETVYWYKVFIPSMSDIKIGVIYDSYIVVSIIVLYLYTKYYDSKLSRKIGLKILRPTNILNNNFILILVSLLPFFYILINGKLKNYLNYGLNINRGILDSNFNRIMSQLILISLISFTYYFFKNKKRSYLVLIIYLFLLIWIQGKRFIIALIGIICFFYLVKGELKKSIRNKLEYIILIFAFILIIFSYYYLKEIRPLSQTDFESIYEMLRVDFGRDDVIKFVIEQELILNNKILNYNGQSFLSTFFVFIPRIFWETKPYQHYVYLTSKILNLSFNNLPAGTTPSWYEMCIANFQWYGIVIGIIFLPIMCWIIDRTKFILLKVIFLILLLALLTQSIDAYISLIFLGVLVLCLTKININIIKEKK